MYQLSNYLKYMFSCHKGRVAKWKVILQLIKLINYMDDCYACTINSSSEMP